MNEQLVVLGYDGVPFDLLMELVYNNKLDNFKNLIKNGSYGVLNSTLPPISPVAWPSILTGENPGRHGIFSFFEHDAGIIKTTTSKKIQGKTIFDILGNSNKKIIGVNIPCTFPAWEINGILIPGFPVPGEKNHTFPEDILKNLENKIGKYYVDLPSEGLHVKGMTEKKFLEEVNYITEKRTESIMHMIKNYEWDFFMGVYIGTDRLLHAYFGNYDKNNRLYNEEKSRIIVNYFQELDAYLGEILSVIDAESHIMIISDHGFEPFNKIIGINNVLANARFIDKTISVKGKFKKTLLKLLKKIDVNALVKIEKVSKRIGARDPLGFSRSNEFEKSLAISIHVQGISINKNKLAGQSYDRLKKEIIDLALSIKDPETGVQIIEKVYDRKDIYSGDNFDKAPDLLLIPKRGYAVDRWFSDKPIPINDAIDGISRTGTHAGFEARRGLHIIHGKDVRKNFRYDASILDIAPTILHLLNVPIIKTMDGQILKNVFNPSSQFVQRPARMMDLEEIGGDSKIDDDDEDELSQDDEELILRRLKKLGYIS